MADVLPGYRYERTTHRYRSDATGRFVSRTDITGLLRTQVDGLENRLGALVTAVAERQLAPAWALEQMRTELRRAHLQNRALGAGGWDRLSPSDYGSTGRRLRDDYGRLLNMVTGLADGSVTLPQALNRINGYAGSARIEFLEAERQRQQADGNVVLLMIRDLGIAEHCESCVEYYQRGWAVDLPLPGEESPCGTHCRCGIRYREVPVEDAGEWIGTRRG